MKKKNNKEKKTLSKNMSVSSTDEKPARKP